MIVFFLFTVGLYFLNPYLLPVYQQNVFYEGHAADLCNEYTFPNTYVSSPFMNNPHTEFISYHQAVFKQLHMAIIYESQSFSFTT